jgi:hypothetical protein
MIWVLRRFKRFNYTWNLELIKFSFNWFIFLKISIQNFFYLWLEIHSFDSIKRNWF